MRHRLLSTLLFSVALTLGTQSAFGYMQVGFVKARVSCSAAPNGASPWSSEVYGYINANGFVLYKSYFSSRHSEIGYNIITARRNSGFAAKNGFVISGYGTREGGDRWDFKFSMPDTGTLADALVTGIEGFENPKSSKWKRKCTIKAGENGIAAFTPSTLIRGYRDQISELKDAIKEASLDTTELNAAVARADMLEKELEGKREDALNIQKRANAEASKLKALLEDERENALAFRNKVKTEKSELEVLLEETKAQNVALRADLAKAKENTPEVYARTSLELSKTKKALSSSESKAAAMEIELEASQKLLDDLMALVDDKTSETQALNKRLAELADVDGKIASLESSLNKAQNSSDELLKARDRVIAAQSSEIARLESLVAESQSDQEVTIDRLQAEKSTLEAALRASESRLQQLGQMLGVKVEKFDQSADGLQDGPDTPPSWDRYESTISIQQQQFCSLTEKFYAELKEARDTNNDIKVNNVFKDRQDDLDALVPQGKFNNWIFEVVRIEQVPDGSAAVVVKTQCDTLVGSGYLPTRRSFLDDDNKTWRATIPYEDRRFRELAKLSSGQFVTGSGALLEIEAYKPGQPETFYASMPVGEHPIVSKLQMDGELFIAEFSYIAALSN